MKTIRCILFGCRTTHEEYDHVDVELDYCEHCGKKSLSWYRNGISDRHKEIAFGDNHINNKQIGKERSKITLKKLLQRVNCAIETMTSTFRYWIKTGGDATVLGCTFVPTELHTNQNIKIWCCERCGKAKFKFEPSKSN